MVDRSRFRLVGCSVAAGALALLSTACGGASGTIAASGGPTPIAGSDAPSASPGGRMSVASLRQAAASVTTATSGRMEMTMQFSEPGGDGEMSMGMTGSFDGDRSHFSTTFNMSDLMAEEFGGTEFGQMMDSEIIVIGEDSYLRGGMFSMFAGDTVGPDTWLKMPAMGAQEMSSMSPDMLNELLDGAYGDVTEVGSADVRGVATTQYRVLLDPEQLVGTVADELSPSELGAIDELAMDVFVGGDGLVRRMMFAPEIEGMTMTMTVDYFDLGQPITIEAPTEVTEFDPATALGGMAEGFEDLFGELDSAD